MAPKRKAGVTTASAKTKKLKHEVATIANDQNDVPESPKTFKTSFLSLPTELRVRVYQYLFPNKRVPAVRPRVSDVGEFRQALRDDGQPCHTAIIATCKEIHEEACDVLYGSVPYEMNILGSFVRSCMHGGGRTLSQAFLDGQYGYSSWTLERRMRKSKVRAATYDGDRTALMSYVRNIELVVELKPDGGWSRVHSTALRKEMTDKSFAEMFAHHETPMTIRTLMDCLQEAPKLKSIKISAEHPSGWNEHVSDHTVEKVFSAFKNTRFKHVSFGDLVAAPETHAQTNWARHLWSRRGRISLENRDDFTKLKDDIIRAMAKDEAPPDWPIDPKHVRSLKQFVRQFHGQPFFHEICKELYEALEAAGWGNKSGFKHCQERVIAVWEKEEQRLRQLIESARAPLADLDREPGSPSPVGPGKITDACDGRGTRACRTKRPAGGEILEF